MDERGQGRAAVPGPLPAAHARRPRLLRPAPARGPRGAGRAGRGLRHPRLLLLPLLVPRQAAARAAVRRGARSRASPTSRSACAGRTSRGRGAGTGARTTSCSTSPTARRTTSSTSAGCSRRSPTRARSRSTGSRSSSSTRRRTFPIPPAPSTSGARRSTAPACPGIYLMTVETGWDAGWDATQGRLRRQDPLPAPVLGARPGADALRRAPRPCGCTTTRPRGARWSTPSPRPTSATRRSAPRWDNSPRTGANGVVLHRSTPEGYGEWLATRDLTRPGRARGPATRLPERLERVGRGVPTSSPTSSTAAGISRRPGAPFTAQPEPCRMGQDPRTKPPAAA